MTDFSFFWHDYETFGRVPRRDRPAQFAGIRTDADLNEIGQPVMRYFLHRCWVSEYQAMPDLDAGSTSVAIEHIKMENEGWEKDLTLTEPTET